MSEKWETKILKATEEVPDIALALIVVGIISFLIYRSMNKPEKEDWTKQVTNSKDTASENNNKSSGPLKNIWDERQRNGSSEADKIQRTDSEGKPFGSSYYYAHNNLRKTGGYTDGLRMEDYQMGAPRLLSKGGVDYRDAQPTTGPVDPPTSAPEKRVAVVSCIPITKYLWDDPGDHKAIGTIRIDQLEDKLSWKEAEVEDIKIDLQGETSLTVVVHVKDGKMYRLHIPQLFGKVQEVKKVSKEKRLLVRLYKRNKQASDGTTDNKAWATPYKKGTW